MCSTVNVADASERKHGTQQRQDHTAVAGVAHVVERIVRALADVLQQLERCAQSENTADQDHTDAEHPVGLATAAGHESLRDLEHTDDDQYETDNGDDRLAPFAERVIQVLQKRVQLPLAACHHQLQKQCVNSIHSVLTPFIRFSAR